MLTKIHINSEKLQQTSCYFFGIRYYRVVVRQTAPSPEETQDNLQQIVFFLKNLLALLLINNYLAMHWLLMFEVIKKPNLNENFATYSLLGLFIGVCWFLPDALKLGLGFYKDYKEISQENHDQKLRKIVVEVVKETKKC